MPGLLWQLALLAGTLALLVGIVGAHTTHSVPWVRFFDNLHWTAGTLLAAVLAWVGAGSAPAHSARGLRWIAIGLSAYAVGQIVWDVQVLVDFTGLATPADFFYLWLGPLVGGGLLIEAFRLADRIQRKTLVLDAAILAIASLTLVLVLYLPQRGDLSMLSLAVLVAYPVTLFSAASIGFIAAPTLRLRFVWSYWLFLASLVVTGVCWMVWNLMALEGASTSGTWINSLFSLSIAGMGLATLFWQFEPSHHVLWDRVSESFLRLLPLTAVVVSSLAVILLLSQGGCLS